MGGFPFSVLVVQLLATYFPEPSKSFVVVSEHCRTEPEALFQNLEVHIVTEHT